MKSSVYNYITESDNKIYCLNGLSFLYFNIDKSKGEILQAFFNNPDSYKAKMPQFYDKMIQGSFIVEEAVDELEIIKKNNLKAQNSRDCMLIILPTFDCNFSCWYCIQNHQKNRMSPETIEKTKNYIKNLVENKLIDSLYIDWFGGEPFLYFEEVMLPILSYAQNICKKNNVEFFTCATTNGFLISPEIAEKLEQLDFKELYITLDGDKEHHDRTRVSPTSSSFDTILQNVDILCDKSEKIIVTLRINYDEENLNPEKIINQVKSIIQKKNQHRISFNLRKVWQVDKVENGKEKVRQFVDILKSSDFSFGYSNDLITDFIPCYAARKSTKIITPNGFIGKCSAKEDFETISLGKLSENGTILWSHKQSIDDLYASPLFNNERCLSCKYLPICMGPCPNNIDPKTLEIKEYGCKRRLNDFSFEDTILNYCELNDLLNN